MSGQQLQVRCCSNVLPALQRPVCCSCCCNLCFSAVMPVELCDLPFCCCCCCLCLPLSHTAPQQLHQRVLRPGLLQQAQPQPVTVAPAQHNASTAQRGGTLHSGSNRCCGYCPLCCFLSCLSTLASLLLITSPASTSCSFPGARAIVTPRGSPREPAMAFAAANQSCSYCSTAPPSSVQPLC
jgi:hypothetical protein